MAAVGSRVHGFRGGRGRPALAIAAWRCVSGGGGELPGCEHVGQHAQVAPEHRGGLRKPGRSGSRGVLLSQFLRTNKGGAGQVKRLCDIVDVMINAGDERGIGHGQVVRSMVLLGAGGQGGRRGRLAGRSVQADGQVRALEVHPLGHVVSPTRGSAAPTRIR
jgi:hypothetical protein